MNGELKNLGPVSHEWLRSVGIHSRTELEEVGALEAFHRVRLHGFNASVNLLYALEAALRDVHWTALPPADKAKLKAAASALKRQR